MNNQINQHVSEHRPGSHIHDPDAPNLLTLIRFATRALTELALACESRRIAVNELLQLMPGLKEFETARRGLAILDARIAETTASEQLSRILGTTCADDFLDEEFRLTRRDATNRIAATGFLETHPDLRAPADAALRAGDMTLSGLADVAKEVEALDERVDRPASDVAEEVITRSPCHGPHGAGALCRKLVKRENNRFPRDPNAAHKKRRLAVGKQDGDGGAKVSGYLDAATLALLETWLLTNGLKKGSRDDGRTPVQRNADALDFALRTAHEAHPRVKGKPMCTIIAALDMDDLQAATGMDPGRPASGQAPSGQAPSESPASADPHSTNLPHPMHPAHSAHPTHPTRTTVKAGSGVELGLIDLLRLGLSEDMYAAVIDRDAPVVESQLKLGRTKRSADLDLRIALQLLDGTCRHPGCSRPPDACDAHHLVAWLLGGATDLDNLTLLCRRHHSDNDDTRADPRRGHMTPRSDDARGRTGWAFPAGVDGTRKVRFNGAGGVAA